MRCSFGVILPTDLASQTLAELTYAAEQAGWDGAFVWDGIFGYDPWVAPAAMARRTRRVRRGNRPCSDTRGMAPVPVAWRSFLL